MKKTLALVLLVPGFQACSSPRAVEKAPAPASPAPSTSTEPAPAERFPEGAALCLVLARGNLVASENGTCPAEFHVRGTWKAGRFVVAGDVEGGGALATHADGMPGWVEIMGGGAGFVPAPTARPPFCPCVHGVQKKDGTFVPSSRGVEGPSPPG